MWVPMFIPMLYAAAGYGHAPQLWSALIIMIDKALALPKSREGVRLATIPWGKFLGAIDAFTGSIFHAGEQYSTSTCISSIQRHA